MIGKLKLLLQICVLGVLALGLAACATNRPPSFNAKQVAALTQAGFVPEEGNYVLGLSSSVLFGSGSADLGPETVVQLSDLSKNLVYVGIFAATIEGHTDSVGSPDDNKALSLLRAQSVAAALVGGGMQSGGMMTAGLGETDPIESNDTEEGRNQNRRVTIIVSPQNTVPLG